MKALCFLAQPPSGLSRLKPSYWKTSSESFNKKYRIRFLNAHQRRYPPFVTTGPSEGGGGIIAALAWRQLPVRRRGYIGVMDSCHQVVHWNAPHEEILSFSVWRHDFFLSRDVHSKRVYNQEEKLSALFVVSNGSGKPFRICPDHILLQLINSGHADSSMADKNHS